MNITATIRFVLLHLLVLIAVILVAGVVMNTSLFDEELLPILKARESREVNLDPSVNAFPLLLGIDAAPEKAAVDVGQRMIEELRAKATAGEPIFVDNDRVAELKGYSSTDDAEWREPYPSLQCNPRLDIDCMAQLIEEVRTNPPTDGEVEKRLQRYRSLVALPTFSEMPEGDVSTNLPAYQDALHLGRLAIAHSYVSDSPKDFVRTLSDDMSFWRMMLRDGSTLIAKMVANVGIRANLQTISLAINQRMLDDLADVGPLLTPLSPQETDIGESFWSEQDIVFVEIERLDRGFNALITQPNATKNAYYRRHTEPLLMLAKMVPIHFAQEAVPPPGSDYGIGPLTPNPYNLGGRLVLSMFAGSTYDYIGRIHDLNGMIALVALQLEANLSEDAELTLSRQTQIVDPFSGDPVAFDVESGELGFQCFAGRRFPGMNPRENCSVRIRSTRF